MKTLVIHPKDLSTDFLSVIYRDKDWTLIDDPKVSKKTLIESIKTHDRIIMLGHGTEHGLIAMTGSYNFRFLIDSDLVYLLREKSCVSIWCNANVFVEKYGLTGFYTGMIISEMEEAYMYNVTASETEINESNILFSNSIKEALGSADILETAKNKYSLSENPIINFNKNNLYEKKN